MAMLKIAILLLVVFKATALEHSHEIGSNHELDPFYSPAPSPSTDHDEHKKITIMCAMECITKCEDKISWQKALCIGACLIQCAINHSDSVPASETACVGKCIECSANNLHFDPNMIDDRMTACTQQCKKD